MIKTPLTIAMRVKEEQLGEPGYHPAGKFNRVGSGVVFRDGGSNQVTFRPTHAVNPANRLQDEQFKGPAEPVSLNQRDALGSSVGNHRLFKNAFS